MFIRYNMNNKMHFQMNIVTKSPVTQLSHGFTLLSKQPITSLRCLCSKYRAVPFEHWRVLIPHPWEDCQILFMKITCFAIGLHIASALKNIEFSVEYAEYKPKIFAQRSLHFISQNKAYHFAINYNHDKLWLIIIILHLEWSGVRQYKCARTMCKRLL